MLVHMVGLFEDDGFFMNDPLQASSDNTILEEPLDKPSTVQRQSLKPPTRRHEPSPTPTHR